jgi:short-chain fatty acids transporter
MLRPTTRFFVRFADRWMPDPLVVAIFLTFVCIAAALVFTDFGVLDAGEAWGIGFWKLLAFTMQIVLILGLGHLVAHTNVTHRLLVKIADQVRSAKMAYAGLAFIAGFCGLFSWGLALIAPAVLSRIIGASCKRRGIKLHFPLLVACGWLGFGTSMQGLSASIPLMVNTPGHFLESQTGLIALSATIFSIWSMSIVATKLVAIPFVVSLLAPPPKEVREMPELGSTAEVTVDTKTKAEMTPSERVENARIITLSLAALGTFYLIVHYTRGGSLNLNTINMIFLVLGLALADSPKHYLELLSNAGRVVAPFIIQYPLYAGIMGVIAVSGLGELIVQSFVAISDKDSLPIWTFFSAGLLNLFVPSAGGQLAIQGPIAVDAALQLGADIPRVLMALTIGEAWTNAIQPLYAIPVLAVAGLHVRDVMGYGVIICMLTGTIYLTALILF